MARSEDVTVFMKRSTKLSKRRLSWILVELVGAQLKAMGHDVRSTNGEPMGGFQAIMVSPETGAYRAGSDHRKDGQAVGH